jgi:hypothetical protein
VSHFRTGKYVPFFALTRHYRRIVATEGAWRRRVAGALLALAVSTVVAVGVGFYAATHPCWPWQEIGSYAGGTTCDGHQARFDTD